MIKQSVFDTIHPLFPRLGERAYTPSPAEEDAEGTYGNLASEAHSHEWMWDRGQVIDPGAGEVAYRHVRSDEFLDEIEEKYDLALHRVAHIRQLSQKEIDAWIAEGRPRLRQETPERIAQLDAQMVTFKGVPKGAAELYGPRIRN